MQILLTTESASGTPSNRCPRPRNAERLLRGEQCGPERAGAAAGGGYPLRDFYALDLAHRLAVVADRHKGPMPRVIQLMDHNHVSVVAQFNTPCNDLGDQIRDWFERVLRGDFGLRNQASALSA